MVGGIAHTNPHRIPLPPLRWGCARRCISLTWSDVCPIDVDGFKVVGNAWELAFWDAHSGVEKTAMSVWMRKEWKMSICRSWTWGKTHMQWTENKMTVQGGDFAKCQLYYTGYTFDHWTNLNQVHITMIRKHLGAWCKYLEIARNNCFL